MVNGNCDALHLDLAKKFLQFCNTDYSMGNFNKIVGMARPLQYSLTQEQRDTLTLFFSYYIFKRYALHKFFRIVLFLPSVLAGIVLAVIYENFIDKYIPDTMLLATGRQTMGLLTAPNTKFGALLSFRYLLLSDLKFYCIHRPCPR